MQLTADLFPQTSRIFTVSELTRSIRGTLSIVIPSEVEESLTNKINPAEREICPTRRQLLISSRKPRRSSLSLSSREASAARSRRNRRSLGPRRISNYKLHPSGHQYFTLKDQRAQIACVIWRDNMAPLRHLLPTAHRCRFMAQSRFMKTRGQYQLSVQILQPRGVGLLQAKFEALKRKLEAEDFSHRNASDRYRNFHGESDSSPRRAAQPSATCRMCCVGARPGCRF